MHLILLPGMSAQNRIWIDRVEHLLQPIFPHTAVLYYDHWWSGDESATIDLDAELLKLAGIAQEIPKYALFAKSAGVLLAMRGIHAGVLEPEICTFVGSAIRWGLSEYPDMDTWFTNYSIPTLFIQKEHDPAFFASELSDFLKEHSVSCERVVTIPGDDHGYEDTQQLLPLIEEFYDR